MRVPGAPLLRGVVTLLAATLRGPARAGSEDPATRSADMDDDFKPVRRRLLKALGITLPVSTACLLYTSDAADEHRDV